MTLRGHVCDGVIVLDDPVQLPEGATVVINLSIPTGDDAPYRRYRGLPYRYDAPFEPAMPVADWEAER